MPLRDQAQLFGSFFRVRRPETKSIKGTGLGLSVVKGLVGLMRGEVWADSELNKGSRFFFTIPTVPSDGDGVEMGQLSVQPGETNDDKAT